MDKRERVAQAIADSQEFWWDDLEQSQKEDFMRDADAAIAALESVRTCAKCGHIKP